MIVTEITIDKKAIETILIDQIATANANEAATTATVEDASGSKTKRNNTSNDSTKNPSCSVERCK